MLTELIFGEGYKSAAHVLPTLTWSLVPFVAVLYGSIVLVARNQERCVMLAHGLALFLAIGLGSAGMVRSGLTGLALSLVITEAVHAVILVWMVSRGKHDSP